MEKKYRELIRETSALQTQVRDKDEQLQKLRTGMYYLSYIFLLLLLFLFNWEKKKKTLSGFSWICLSYQTIIVIILTVSEAVCKEYEQLKRQYDVETGAMHKAMQQASQVG